MTRRTAALLLALLATGCGQTGDLFLPREPSPATEAGEQPPANTPGEESADTDDDDEETPAR